MNIQQYIPLDSLSSFKTGGKARYFIVVQTKEELREAFQFVRAKKLPYFILGGGSNVLISDKGFKGVVIKVDILGITENDLSNTTQIIAGAGELWDGLVAHAVQKNLFGLENLSGIPGNVGGAPVQNIGAYGSEVKDVIEWVEVFDTKKDVFKKLSPVECKFFYRESIFKKPAGNHYVITAVAFLLKKKGVLNLRYKDITNYFSSKETPPTLQEVRSAVLEIRSRKFPDLKQYGTAGSFFKNPLVTKRKFAVLKKKYPDLPGFPLLSPRGERVKIPLAWVIDKICGLKGYQLEQAGVFENQAIVLINLGGANTRTIKELSEKIKKSVKEKTGIKIEMEVREI